VNEDASRAEEQRWRGNEENEKATETKEKLQIYSISFHNSRDEPNPLKILVRYQRNENYLKTWKA
jgi:hypothetical protein